MTKGILNFINKLCRVVFSYMVDKIVVFTEIFREGVSAVVVGIFVGKILGCINVTAGVSCERFGIPEMI